MTGVISTASVEGAEIEGGGGGSRLYNPLNPASRRKHKP